jgi:hypothetical protein
MFAELARRLSPRSDADALSRVKGWLAEQELSDQQLHAISAALPTELPRPMDWTKELAGLVEHSLHREPFMPISTGVGAALAEALRLPRDEKVACLYPGSSTIAWGLARARPTTLRVAHWGTSFLMALLAFADGRSLHVTWLNHIEPLSPTDGEEINRFEESHSPRTGEYDHIVAVPPIGFRIRQGQGAGMLFEAWQAEQLAPRADKSFASLASDGVLFRETRGEVEFRKRLCKMGRLSVTSLPPGIFGRASGVQGSLLRVEHGRTNGGVTFIDGRSMERVSRSGREQEELIVKHLDRLDNAPVKHVSEDELAESNFSLLPSRYIVSDEIARVDEALADRPTIRLGDIANVIRPRAPQPVRGDPSDDDVVCLEIVVADIIDGKVGPPSKEARYPAKESESVRKVMVHSDDILVSVKGNVGLVGLVDSGRVMLDKVMGTPEVISQSLAIVRIKESSPIKQPRVLAGILASPQMRAKLQTLSAGTTVPTLPISALQDLQVPLPDEAEVTEIETRMAELDDMQKDIDERSANRRILQDALWLKFWNMPSEQEEA